VNWLNRTHVGDCRDLLARMASDGVRVQTCVTSPPYFGLRDYGHPGQIGLEETPAEYVAELVSVFRRLRDVLADDATLWLNLGDSYARGFGGGSPGPKSATNVGAYRDRKLGRVPPGFNGKDILGIPWRVALALQGDGWILRGDIVWHKPNPMPESVADRPTRSHEFVFLLAKSPRYYYDANAVKERTDEGVRSRRSVWSIPTHPYRGAHFATFPPALIEPCILAGSKPGGVVLDPFMGSGTTAVVARSLGRQYIGCEINPAYVEMAEQRIAI
jgi:DNA modification methylase